MFGGNGEYQGMEGWEWAEEVKRLNARVILLEAEKDIAVRMANFRTIECRQLRDKLYGEDKV